MQVLRGGVLSSSSSASANAFSVSSDAMPGVPFSRAGARNRRKERRTEVERSRSGRKDRGIHEREYNGCLNKTYTAGEKKCELRENDASVTIVPGHR